MMLSSHVADKLRDSRYRLVVTGAGGWLGMATLDLVSSALGDTLADRVCCFGSGARTLTLLDGTQIDQRPLDDLGLLAPRPTLVLHFAFLTKDRAEAMPEEEYYAANRAIGQTVLDSLDSIGAEAIFVASSGAAAFAEDPNASPAMRLYGRLKKDDEQLFALWAEEAGKRAVITRIFNLSGPYMNKHGSYALASFILDALAGRPVEVRAEKPVIRAYVAIRELMSLVFALLLEGERGVVRFDTGGQTMEMQVIAEAVAEVCGPVPVHRPPLGDAPADEYAGNPGAYEALLRNKSIPVVAFEQQIAETAEFLSEIEDLGWMRQKQRASAGVAPSVDAGIGATLTKPRSEAAGDRARNLNG
jgi:nucleoside-diphosphate-sugar epimerase